MKRRTAILILCFLSVSFLLFAQESERRTALVIGNSDYRSSPLKNPVNDARDLSQALGELGFAVTTKLNSSHKEMFEAVRDFGKELARGGVGLFFYAGHAVEVGGTNYLIPVDADIQAEDEVRFASIDAGLVLSKMESAGNSTNIVILDACRDNPFKKSFRSSSRGLAVVQAPRGSLVIYATAPGSVAADGKGRNGIFTGSLLHHIKTPGIEVREMLTRVRREVMAATGGEQIPWDSSSLTAGFYFTGTGGWAAAASEAERRQTITVEKAYGSLVVQVETAGAFYLDGMRQARVPRGGTARVTDLETGSHRLEMRYDDGEKETKRVTVVKDRAVQVAFSYVERPRVPEGFVLVEAGTFRMGSTGGDDDEKPVHRVTISRSFYMSKYEVTVEGFRRFVNDTGYKTTAERQGGAWNWTGSEVEKETDANWRNLSFNQGEDNPVVCLSWYDAVEYCNWLSRREGLTPAYRINGENVTWETSANGYRLPTEAEWEYAARGGNRSRGYTYSGSDSAGDVGWYGDNSGDKTHPVGQKRPNELGLYDMSGNVWEWCWDRYDGDYYASSPSTDPIGPSSDSFRVFRGGSWLGVPEGLQADNRFGGRPSLGFIVLGFRPVRTAE